MPNNYTNQELAAYHLSIISQFQASATQAQIKRSTRIATSAVNISRRYHEQGSLSDLKIGLNRETLNILELILKKGFDKAKRIVFDRKYTTMKPEKWPQASRRSFDTGEDNPSWSVAYARHEGE
jgi:hypothetical protein